MDELGDYLDIEITDKMKSKNLKFFDLMFTFKPKLAELDDFLTKNSYSFVKNCPDVEVNSYLKTITDGAVCSRATPLTQDLLTSCKLDNVEHCQEVILDTHNDYVFLNYHGYLCF